MIILRIGVEGATEEKMVSLINHLELEAGFWSLLCREVVRIESRTFDAPVPSPSSNQLDGIVLG